MYLNVFISFLYFKALEEQHRSLEKTLEELRQYKKQHEEWSELLNKILSEQAPVETRIGKGFLIKIVLFET